MRATSTKTELASATYRSVHPKPEINDVIVSKLRTAFVALGVLVAGVVGFAHPGDSQSQPYQIAQATCQRYVSTTNDYGLYRGQVFASLPPGIPASAFVTANIACGIPTSSPPPTPAPTASGTAVPTPTAAPTCLFYVSVQPGNGVQAGQAFTNPPTGVDVVQAGLPCGTPTATPIPTGAPTASPSSSPTATPSATPTPTATPTATASPTPSPTPTSSPLFGGFLRSTSIAPYNGLALTAGTSQPNPYPVRANYSSEAAFCAATDTSGNSIISANPLDPTKSADLLQIGVKETRQDQSTYFQDYSFFHTDANFQSTTPQYNLQGLDGINCFEAAHGITPVISLNPGAIQYNENPTGFNVQQHNLYDSAQDFGNYCSAIATHEAAQGFHNYSAPGNEVNSFYGSVFPGDPTQPIAVPNSTSGTIAVGTSVAYRIVAIIPQGMTDAGAESNAVAETSGNGSIRVSWGTFPTATSYEVFGRTAGSEQLLATVTAVAGYQQSWIDTGANTPSGALPSTNAVLVAATEAQIAGYEKNCYSAIHAADSQAVVYGFELDDDGGLNPSAAQFVHDERVNFGCGPGTCYDGIALHTALRYPVPAAGTPCYPNAGGDYTIACLDDVETAAGQSVPLDIGETVITWPGFVADAATAGLATTTNLAQLKAYPQVKFINWANVDECDAYPSGYFMNGCLIDLNHHETPQYVAAYPFYNGGATAPPTAAPTASPTPSPTPAPTTTPQLATVYQANGAYNQNVPLNSAPSPGNYAICFEVYQFNLTGESCNNTGGQVLPQLNVTGTSWSIAAWGATLNGTPTNMFSTSQGASTFVVELGGVSAPTFTSLPLTTTTGPTTTVSISGVIAGAKSVLAIHSSADYTVSTDNGSFTGGGTDNSSYDGSDSARFWLFTPTASGTINITITAPAGTSLSAQLANMNSVSGATPSPSPSATPTASPSPSPSPSGTPTIAQSAGHYISPATLAAAPTNGDTIVCMQAYQFNLVGTNCEDANGSPTLYPQIDSTNSSNNSVAAWMGVVSGSPANGVFSFTHNAWSTVFDLKNVSATPIFGNFHSDSTTTGTSTVALTGLTAGAIQLIAVDSSDSADTVAISNGTISGPAFDGGSTARFYTVTATSTGASTITVTAATGSNVSIEFVALNPAGASLAVGTAVTTWRDKSGNGNNVTQATTADQPTIGLINGVKAVALNGAGQFLAATSSTALPIGASPFTVFVVAVDSNIGANYPSVVQWGGIGSGFVTDLIFQQNDGLRLAQDNSSGGVAGLIITSPIDTNPHTLEATYSGGDVGANGALLYDGNAQSVATFGTPYTFATTGSALQIGNNAGSTFPGAIGEVLVFSGALSTANRQYIEGGEACKWGTQSQLPSGHPYKSTCPTSYAPSTVSGLALWLDGADSSTFN
jgi:hypothetical protein